jgi:hypothetical protein
VQNIISLLGLVFKSTVFTSSTEIRCFAASMQGGCRLRLNLIDPSQVIKINYNSAVLCRGLSIITIFFQFFSFEILVSLHFKNEKF